MNAQMFVIHAGGEKLVLFRPPSPFSLLPPQVVALALPQEQCWPMGGRRQCCDALQGLWLCAVWVCVPLLACVQCCSSAA
jgi:hypothetical protein